MAAAASALPPPASFAALPAELLALVFARLPLRPRLQVIARVCRRWRGAAYLSVASIPAVFHYDGPFARYPNLTECTFREERGVPTSWTTEERARIRSASFERSTTKVLEEAKLSSLTCLRMFFTTGVAVEMTSDLVSANATSVTHLDICMKATRGPMKVAKSVPPMPALLPALRSLDLSFSIDSLAVFSPAFSQLQHLYVPFADKRLFSHPLPALRTLTIGVAMDLDVDDRAAKWLALVPSLTELHVMVWFFYFSAAMALTLRSVLCSAPLNTDTAPATVEGLCQCPRLSRLVCNFVKVEGDVGRLRPLARLAGQLTSLSITHDERTPCPGAHFLLATLTALTCLELHPSGLADTLHGLRLPHLRELSVARESLDWATLALRTFPTLLRLWIGSLQSERDVAAFEAEVRAADRRGMALVQLGGRRGHSTLQRNLHWLTLLYSTDWPVYKC